MPESKQSAIPIVSHDLPPASCLTAVVKNDLLFIWTEPLRKLVKDIVVLVQLVDAVDLGCDFLTRLTSPAIVDAVAIRATTARVHESPQQ